MEILTSEDADAVADFKDMKCKLYAIFLNGGFLLASDLVQAILLYEVIDFAM